MTFIIAFNHRSSFRTRLIYLDPHMQERKNGGDAACRCQECCCTKLELLRSWNDKDVVRGASSERGEWAAIDGADKTACKGVRVECIDAGESRRAARGVEVAMFGLDTVQLNDQAEQSWKTRSQYCSTYIIGVATYQPG